MTISEVSKKYNLTPDTLRYYEKNWYAFKCSKK